VAASTIHPVGLGLSGSGSRVAHRTGGTHTSREGWDRQEACSHRLEGVAQQGGVEIEKTVAASDLAQVRRKKPKKSLVDLAGQPEIVSTTVSI